MTLSDRKEESEEKEERKACIRLSKIVQHAIAPERGGRKATCVCVRKSESGELFTNNLGYEIFLRMKGKNNRGR